MNNRVRVTGRRMLLTVTDGGVLAGDPCLVGQMAGVVEAPKDANNNAVVVTEGVYNLSVKGANDAGNAAIAVGDVLVYVTTDTPKLSKKSIAAPNQQDTVVLTQPLTPAAVAANTTAEQTFTVAGLAAGDQLIAVEKPTAQAGLGIAGWRIVSATQVAITFVNDTAGALTPTAAETYTFEVARLGGGSGVKFGYALATVGSGATATIPVKLAGSN